jgi:hypothetical protein
MEEESSLVEQCGPLMLASLKPKTEWTDTHETNGVHSSISLLQFFSKGVFLSL